MKRRFWPGDKKSEGALKSLATAEEFDYERKGVDPYRGKSYLRLMLASNEEWVVPAGSGGRRWFVLEVGDERKEDHAFFKALDEEMQNGGLRAMLYDLQRHDFSNVNVRKAPVTDWLLDQRLHSSDSKRRWWRDVLAYGGFRIDEGDEFVKLSETELTCVSKEDVFRSARPHFGTERRKASKSEVGRFLKKMLSKLPEFEDGPRLREDDDRQRTHIFPALVKMRKAWEELIGDAIGGDEETCFAVAKEATRERLRQDFTDEKIRNRLTAALLSQDIKDPERIRAAIDAVLSVGMPTFRKNFSVVPGGRGG